MSRWALIAGGVVVNCVEQSSAPSLPGLTAVNIDAQPAIGPGHLWDGTNFQPPPTRYGWMRSGEFLRKFNRADRKTIKDSTDPIVADAMWQLQVNGIIDFADPDMQAFMDQLVTLNIIGNPKKNRIYSDARFEPVP